MTPDDLPPGPVILDTDAATRVHRGGEQARRFSPFLVGRLLALSFATVAEWRFGAVHAGWGDRRRRELEDFIARFVVLPGDNATVNAWVEVHRAVRDQIGPIDEWVAASALSRTPRLPLVTGNRRHFVAISERLGLTVVSPLSEPAE